MIKFDFNKIQFPFLKKRYTKYVNLFYHVSKYELFVIQETAGVETWTALNVSAVESKRSSGIAQTSALVPGTTKIIRPKMTTKKHRSHW